MKINSEQFAREFGSLVRRRRQYLGMTAQAAFRKAGTTNKTWKRLEDGLPVKPFTIVALDKVFDEIPGTMMDMWESGNADALRRHWNIDSSPPVEEAHALVEQQQTGITAPDIHLEVGTRQYNESLKFLLRHDSDSIRLLSAPVYQAMQYRADRERQARIADVQQEINEASQALASSTSDYTREYLRKHIKTLDAKLNALQGENTQSASLLGLLEDRRT